MQVDSALFEYADDYALVHQEDDEDIGEHADCKKTLLERKDAVIRRLRRVHEHLGHASFKLMAQILSRAKAPPEVIQIVKNMECRVCDEWKRPKRRRFVTAEGADQPHEVIQVDQFEGVNPHITRRACSQ